MSQKTELRLSALEGRVTALEKRLAEMEAPEEGFKAVHRGRGRWQVVGVSGETLTDRYYSKEEAEDLAEQMNHETLELSA